MELKDILCQRPNSPYFKMPSLHVLVVDMVDAPHVQSWDFAENTAAPRQTRLNKVASITDGKTVAKFTVFEEFTSKIKEGTTYIIKRYSLRGQSPPLTILITKDTLFFRASVLNPPQAVINAARDLIRPSSTLTPLRECRTSEGFLTIKGEVIELSSIKKITTGTEQVPFRTLVLQQEKTQVTLSLWREAAVFDVPLGGILTVTHAKHGKPEYGFRMQTTSFTKMEVEVCNTLNHVEVIGVMEAKCKGTLNLLLSDDSVLEIDDALWEPLDELLKVDKVIVDIEKVGRKVTSITVIQE